MCGKCGAVVYWSEFPAKTGYNFFIYTPFPRNFYNQGRIQDFIDIASAVSGPRARKQIDDYGIGYHIPAQHTDAYFFLSATSVCLPRLAWG